MIILIDNGHGENTPGKCSPDGRFREWAWTRKTAKMLVSMLKERGWDARLLVPEDNDISLSERVRRANAHCKEVGSKNVVLVSIHNNAAGADGKWHEATGFSVFVAPKSSDNSKRLAQLLTSEFGNADLLGNRCVPREKYWTANFAIIAKTNCPAVLTENLFQDNKSEVDYLLTDEAVKEIAGLHALALERYIKG